MMPCVEIFLSSGYTVQDPTDLVSALFKGRGVFLERRLLTRKDTPGLRLYHNAIGG